MTEQWIVGTGFSRGIGFELGKQIRGCGYKLLHIGRKKMGTEDEFLICDLSESVSVKFVKSLHENLLGKNICGFFYGAGIFPMLTLTKESDEERAKFWHSQVKAMQVNYFSCAHLLEEVLPLILSSCRVIAGSRLERQGAIEGSRSSKFIPFVAQISSLAAVDPLPSLELYGITKIATLKYFETLAKQYDPSKLACLSIHPGTVNTDMIDGIMTKPEFKNDSLIEVLKNAMNEGHVISAEQSAKLIADFLFKESFANLRKEAHGKLYEADAKKIFTRDS